MLKKVLNPDNGECVVAVFSIGFGFIVTASFMTAIQMGPKMEAETKLRSYTIRLEQSEYSLKQCMEKLNVRPATNK